MKKTLLLSAVFIILCLLVFFFWSQNKEKFLLQDFVKRNLKAGYYSFPLEVKNKLIHINELTGTENLYGALWKTDDKTFYAGLYFNTNDDNILNYIIFIPLTNPLENVDEKLASSVSKIYFNSIEGDWGCQNINSDGGGGIFCESFWIDESKDKHGVGIVSVRNQTLVYFCSIPKGSEYYNWNSCSEEHAQ